MAHEDFLLQFFLPSASDEVSSLEPLKDLDNIEALFRTFPDSNPNHQKMLQSLAETRLNLIITKLFALAKVTFPPRSCFLGFALSIAIEQNVEG